MQGGFRVNGAISPNRIRFTMLRELNTAAGRATRLRPRLWTAAGPSSLPRPVHGPSLTLSTVKLGQQLIMHYLYVYTIVFSFFLL